MLRLIVLLGFLWVMIPISAQGPTPTPLGTITISNISYGQSVQDTITNELIFDWWSFSGNEGDRVVIRMAGSGGLAPLIGIINNNGDIIARSDMLPDGTQRNAEANGTAELQFVLPESQEYTIIATRVGNADGTTTGSYVLGLQLLENIPTDDFQDVIFRCDQYEITTALTLELLREREASAYFITIYGIDGFLPYLQVSVNIFGQEGGSCLSDGRLNVGSQLTLPGESPVTVTEGSPYNLTQLLDGVQEADEIVMTVGSRDGQPGRYLMVIEGFNIDFMGDQDTLFLRLGPLATASDVLLYMVGSPNNRVDPFLMMTNPSLSTPITCDDVGRRDCPDLPDVQEFEIILGDGRQIRPDRFDAGLRIAPGNLDRTTITLSSRVATATGDYTLLILGSLPASEN
ncbi:MAG: hypothetical protein MUF87_01915 [Anaerolineae bacterium]|jgi:hypothetical protein|nr:hypothetical protein [Anaerolineae bacterium]